MADSHDKTGSIKVGANSKLLKTIFKGSVRFVLDYIFTSWKAAAKTTKMTGLRNILGKIKMIYFRLKRQPASSQ